MSSMHVALPLLHSDAWNISIWWESKQEKFHGAQRILSHGSALTLAMMRAQTFSVYTKPQGARPAHTNSSLFFSWLCINVGFRFSWACITKLWRAFTSIERVRTRTVRVRRQVKFTHCTFKFYVTCHWHNKVYSSIRIQLNMTDL